MEERRGKDIVLSLLGQQCDLGCVWTLTVEVWFFLFLCPRSWPLSMLTGISKELKEGKLLAYADEQSEDQ